MFRQAVVKVFVQTYQQILKKNFPEKLINRILKSPISTFSNISLASTLFWNEDGLFSGFYKTSKTKKLNCNENNDKISPSKDHHIILKDACMAGEMQIHSLIKTLEEAIKETATEYRMRLTKQIEIITEGVNADPLSSYWDKLVEHRVEANNLRQKFESYRCMVEYIGQLAFNLAFCAAVLCNLDQKDHVCNEFYQLEKLSKEQLTENKKIEDILFEVNSRNLFNPKPWKFS